MYGTVYDGTARPHAVVYDFEIASLELAQIATKFITNSHEMTIMIEYFNETQ